MSTSAKAAANARNARLSTGPRTEEGKVRSSHNAVKHGLTAKYLVVSPGQQQEFDELHQALREEIAPQGALEQISFNQLVHAAWNQQRFRALEAEMMTAGLDPLLDDSAAPRLDRLYRYAAAADRAWYRALKELRALQTERGLRLTVEPEVAEAIPALASVPVLSKHVQAMDRAADHAVDQMIDDIVDAPMPAPIPRNLYPAESAAGVA